MWWMITYSRDSVRESWSREANKVSRVRWGNWTNSLCSAVEEDQQPETGKRKGKEKEGKSWIPLACTSSNPSLKGQLKAFRVGPGIEVESSEGLPAVQHHVLQLQATQAAEHQSSLWLVTSQSLLVLMRNQQLMSILEHKNTQLVPPLRKTWATQVTNAFLLAAYCI